METDTNKPMEDSCKSDGTCGRPHCCGGHGHHHASHSEEEEDEVGHDHHHHEGHHHEGNAQNPFANLDEDTQLKIQELQLLEQNFQQLLMQKNAYSMEKNETDLIISEVEKTEGEVLRIVGNQVVIKSTKEAILTDMKRKEELLTKRMKDIDRQEKEFSEKMETLRDEVLAKIKG